MHGLPTRGGYYCAAPWCLLYVNGSKQLVPIAIQLNRGDDNPVFLPNDNWYDWLLAKMFYRSADAQVPLLSSMSLIYYLLLACRPVAHVMHLYSVIVIL